MALSDRVSATLSQITGRGWPLIWYWPSSLMVSTLNAMFDDWNADWDAYAGWTTLSTVTCTKLSIGLRRPTQYSWLPWWMFRTRYIRRIILSFSPYVRSGIRNRLSWERMMFYTSASYPSSFKFIPAIWYQPPPFLVIKPNFIHQYFSYHVYIKWNKYFNFKFQKYFVSKIFKI